MLEIIKLDDGRSVIERAVTWQNPLTLKVFYVPAGFVTDFVSTKFLKMPAKCDIAAVFHDVDYWFQNKTRRESDYDYKMNLQAFDVSSWVYNSHLMALRAFGWVAWNANHEQRKVEGDANKILDTSYLSDVKPV